MAKGNKAGEYLQAGDLEKALGALTEQIRSDPSKVELRIFIFQLLGVLGRWDRAMTQLNVAVEMDSDVALMAQVYRNALNCEVLRASVFKGRRSPLIFGEPLEWMAWLIQVPGLICAGELKAAADMRDKAFDASPIVSGQIDGRPLNGLPMQTSGSDRPLRPSSMGNITGFPLNISKGFKLKNRSIFVM